MRVSLTSDWIETCLEFLMDSASWSVQEMYVARRMEQQVIRSGQVRAILPDLLANYSACAHGASKG